MDPDQIYEKLKDEEWFKNMSLDRQGEICVFISKDSYASECVEAAIKLMRGKNECSEI